MIKNEKLAIAAQNYLSYLETNRSTNTVRSYTSDLEDWLADLERREIQTTRELTRELRRPDIRSYVDGLQQRLEKASVSRRMAAITSFLKWMKMRSYIDRDVWTQFPTIKLPKRVTRVLSFQEVFELIHQPDVSTQQGARDRAIMEVMYGSGLRLEETVGIKIENIKDGFVRVMGKGRKERATPLTQNAQEAIRAYLSFFDERRSGPLFLNHRDCPLNGRSVGRILSKHMKEIHPKKRVHPHLMRHSCATHVMSAGADLATVSQLLGHANLATAQRYTFVDLPALRGEYLDAHPIASGGKPNG